jgi:hypothetical protein
MPIWVLRSRRMGWLETVVKETSRESGCAQLTRVYGVGKRDAVSQKTIENRKASWSDAHRKITAAQRCLDPEPRKIATMRQKRSWIVPKNVAKKNVATPVNLRTREATKDCLSERTEMWPLYTLRIFSTVYVARHDANRIALRRRRQKLRQTAPCRERAMHQSPVEPHETFEWKLADSKDINGEGEERKIKGIE